MATIVRSKQVDLSNLFTLAIQLKGQKVAEQRALDSHKLKMKRSVKDFELVDQQLEMNRQAIARNKAAAEQAQRTQQKTSITDSKSTASQLITLGKQQIKDLNDMTGSDTVFTPKQQEDVMEARKMITSGNTMLANALTQERMFQNPNMTSDEASAFKQTMYSGLDLASANIKVAPMNDVQIDQAKEIRSRVVPGKMAEYNRVAATGDAAAIQAFDAKDGNTYNLNELANARALTLMLTNKTVTDQMRGAEPEVKSQYNNLLWQQADIMAGRKTFETSVKQSWLGASIATQAAQQPDTGVDTVTGGDKKAPAKTMSKPATRAVQGAAQSVVEDKKSFFQNFVTTPQISGEVPRVGSQIPGTQNADALSTPAPALDNEAFKQMLKARLGK